MNNILDKKTLIVESINRKINELNKYIERLNELEEENVILKREIKKYKDNYINEDEETYLDVILLKKRLNTSVSIEQLEKCLMHFSYLNNGNDDEHKRIYSENKVKSPIGSEIINLVATSYYMFETTTKLEKVSGKFDSEKIAQEFYDDYEIGRYVRLSSGERENGTIKYIDQVKLLIYEIYVSDGYKAIYNLLKKYIVKAETIDSKSILQEYTQKYKESPKYTTVNSENGFTATVEALGKRASGIGRSKKQAEKVAAEKYIKQNKIDFNSGDNNINKIRNRDVWVLEDKRRTYISNFIKELNIPSNSISDYVIDAALTHISWTNSNGKNQRELYTLGSIIFSIEMQRISLSEYFDKNNINYKAYLIKKSIMFSEDNVIEKVREKYKDIFIKNIRYKSVLSEEILQMVGYKSILGAIFYWNYIVNDNESEEVENYIYRFIKGINLYDNLKVDYGSWLQDFKQLIDVEINEIFYKEDKEDNKSVFISKSILSFDNYNEKDFNSYNLVNENKMKNTYIEVKEFSKTRLRNSIAKEVFEKMKKDFNLTDNILEIPNIEEYNIFLKDLINYVFKDTGFIEIKLDMVGGLLLNKWDHTKAFNICSSLEKRGLNEIIDVIIKAWIEKHSINLVEKIANDNKNIKPFIDKYICNIDLKRIINDYEENTPLIKNCNINKNEYLMKSINDFIYKYEKVRLINLGKLELSENITIKNDMELGYDIHSYTDEGDDKYIKVLSSNENKYILTSQELRAVKELKEKYYIYNIINLKSYPNLKIIRNPLEGIESGESKITPKEYLLTSTI